MDKSDISLAVIKRLPRYYRHLEELMESGVERISSHDLSVRMNVTASQIRQDLNNFGGFGQQGYGYNVPNLHEQIAKILGIDQIHNMIIVGAGNLGRAIAGYSNFEKRGFKVMGLFDSNPALVGTQAGGHNIYPMDDFEDYIKENNVEIIALTIPREAAQEIADCAVKAGVKAIWNFAPTDIMVPDKVVVENVHLSESLMTLSYTISKMN